MKLLICSLITDDDHDFSKFKSFFQIVSSTQYIIFVIIKYIKTQQYNQNEKSQNMLQMILKLSY